MSNPTHDRIKAMVEKYPVMLFMKGTPDQPQCGFSARVAMVLKDHGKPFASFDVLSDPDIRQGIKEYGNFPTIPQLYVNGELVGGSDIVSEMYISGELQELLDKTAPPPR
ncbi:MAG: Grx4 family monothiol glutaredoxin [Myxococcales bacterium]|nr:Grx4 family monothiol glutaredoxin [Myxococcales bacterium]MCB9543389.1 Grx4 family monothiol glutaredoxin [Myxococcales bacterium]